MGESAGRSDLTNSLTFGYIRRGEKKKGQKEHKINTAKKKSP